MITSIAKRLLVVVAVAAIAISTTGAYFSDSEVLPGNTFTAGTLELAIGSDSVDPITLENMVPGSSVTKTINFSNDGTLDFGSLQLSLGNISDSGNLLGGIDAAIVYKANISTSDETTLDLGSVKADTISGLEMVSDIASQLKAGNQGQVEIIFTLSPDAGNEYQGLSASFDLMLDASQVR